ncbi:MAG: HAMP domain-containing sensor histidine kinase, partial [Bacteroidota bacterium]
SHFIEDEKAYVAAFITDISMRKKFEAERNRYMQELEAIVKVRTQDLEEVNRGLRGEVKEREATELALRESQQLYELIAQNYPNGSINIIDKSFNYLFSGGIDFKEYRPIKGLERLGKSFFTDFDKEKQKLLRSYFQNGLKGIESSCEYELDGKTLIMHTVPIENEAGIIDKLLVVEENVTDLKKAEHDMRFALEKERELNEMKSRFVSMASHEFRTPLATILSSTNLLARYAEQGPTADKMGKHIGRIKSSIKNLTDILNDFLSLEKVQSGKIAVDISVLNLREFITDIIEETRGILKEGQYFEIKDGLNQPELATDPKLLKHILLNIISNASKYSSENSKILVETSAEHRHALISITDQGIGVPEEEQKRMFERFFRAKNASNIQGTGLGLFIVHKYANLLKGTVEMESREGIGSTFKIRLPYEKAVNSGH